MSDKAKYSGEVWFVRGVPAELRAEVAAAAERAGMKIGAWVERVLRAALDRPGDVAHGPGADLGALVVGLVERVEALEARAGRKGAAAAARTAPDAVEPARGAHKVPAERKAHPGPSSAARKGKVQTRRKWSDDDDDALRRIARAGGTQADARRELDRPHSVISVKWRALGLN